MSINKTKSLNGLVFKKAYQRLNLSPTNRIVFQRLLGFLIRNDKPFPYSAVKMAELTGLNRATIFRSLNELERCRLIKRMGNGKNRRFARGTILIKIITTVANSIKKELRKNLSTVAQCDKNLLNRRTVRYYNKTYISLKHKEADYSNYVNSIHSDIRLGLLQKNTSILNYEDWLKIID